MHYNSSSKPRVSCGGQLQSLWLQPGYGVQKKKKKRIHVAQQTPPRCATRGGKPVREMA